jgi:hypothetical protein
MSNRPPKRAFQITGAVLTAFTLATAVFAQGGPSIVETIRALLDKGNFYLSKQQFPQAIECYQEVLDQEPNNPYAKSNMVLAHNNWGIFWFHKNKFEEAKAEWEETLKLSPNDRNAKNNLVVLRSTLARMGKNFDDLGAEAKSKEEEKKKAQARANQPPSAVLLTPQKSAGSVDSYDENDLKQAETPSGASLVSPGQPGDTPSPNSSSSSSAGSGPAKAAAPTEAVQSSPAQANPAPSQNQAPATTAPAPVSLSKTKADQELDAFRRLTTGANTAGGANQATPPVQSTGYPFTPAKPYGGGKPVFHASTGSPSFEDDLPPGQPPPQSQAPPAETANQRDRNPVNPLASREKIPVQTTEAQPSTAITDNEEKSHKHKKPAKQVAQVEPWPSSGEGPAPPANIDDLLNRIEIKIYGQPRPQPSVLLRLERIETDSFGHPSAGSIAERVLKLKQMYNLL